MKLEMIGEVPGNVLGMFADLALKMQHGVRTPEQLACFLRGENPFEIKLRLTVNYGDLRWKTVGKMRRDGCVAEDIVASDFPVERQGAAEVVFEIIELPRSTAPKAVIDKFSGQGLRLPDRAESETFIECNGGNFKNKLAAFCGRARVNGTRFETATVYFYGATNMSWRTFDCEWGSGVYILAVRESVTLASEASA
ncbi:MAG: hypothetical protein PHI73_01285 [Patescibacteria group bacterium]|nr:hypothetical protein [Patescibacteria group bacterium]